MNREAIAKALFAVLSSAQVDGQPAFKTVSRRVQLPNQAPTPAMYMGEPKETYLRKSEAVPALVTLEVQVFIYTDAKDPSVVPSTQVNNILDALDTVMTPQAVIPGQSINQTLGGLVSHAWVEGDILKAPGYLDGQGMTLVPIKILVPA